MPLMTYIVSFIGPEAFLLIFIILMKGLMLTFYFISIWASLLLALPNE